MVTHFNIAVDDDVAEQLRSVKEDLGVTWDEFLELAAAELAESEGRPRSGPVEIVRDQDADQAGDQGGEADREAIEAAVGALDLPGSGETLESRRTTVQLLYDYLQENGTARRREFLDLVDAEVVGYASAESFWTNCVKARDSLNSLPGVVAPGEGEHTWRYSGSGDDE